MADFQVNELTSAFLELKFKNERGVSVTPDMAVYRIDDMTGLSETVTGTEIVDDTSFFPTSAKYVLEITSNQNRILDENDIWEDRQVTVTFYYNAISVGTNTFTYRVINLSRINS
jgi:hypothetical protein